MQEHSSRMPVLWAALFLALFLLPGLASAQELDKSDVKCVNSINKGASKVSKAQGKAIASCIKNGGKGKADKLGPAPSTIESCLTADVGVLPLIPMVYKAEAEIRS